MKRAAGQIRKARRNKGGDKDSDYSNDHPNGLHNEHAQQPVRRKPTPDEAALTAKNYRLAKELVRLSNKHFRFHCVIVVVKTLNYWGVPSQPCYFLPHYCFFCFSFVAQSDLRVRHREECKATSRLTMENVSFACWQWHCLESNYFSFAHLFSAFLFRGVVDEFSNALEGCH